MTLAFYYSGTRDLFGSLSLSSSVLALVAISGPLWSVKCDKMTPHWYLLSLVVVVIVLLDFADAIAINTTNFALGTAVPVKFH